MTAIKIKIEGLDAVLAAISGLKTSIEHPDERLTDRIGDAMLEDVDQRFASRGYGTWAPLSLRTIKRKGHSNILVDSGVMRASTTVAKNVNEVVLTVPRGGRNGSAAVPGYHQRGTGRMPQRKIVDVTPQLMARLRDALAKWISNLVADFGRTK